MQLQRHTQPHTLCNILSSHRLTLSDSSWLWEIGLPFQTATWTQFFLKTLPKHSGYCTRSLCSHCLSHCRKFVWPTPEQSFSVSQIVLRPPDRCSHFFVVLLHICKEFPWKIVCFSRLYMQFQMYWTWKWSNLKGIQAVEQFDMHELLWLH